MKDIGREELKQLMLRRLECFRRFNEWEAENRKRPSASEAIRRVGELYEMLPEEAKKKDLAVKVEGIRKMHEALAVLGRKK